MLNFHKKTTLRQNYNSVRLNRVLRHALPSLYFPLQVSFYIGSICVIMYFFSTENEAQEKLEEKVLETVDALSARAAAARATALSNLRSVLQRRPMGHVLGSHRVTLADHVSRALRRGKDAEKRAAASLAPILALQVGPFNIFL